MLLPGPRSAVELDCSISILFLGNVVFLAIMQTFGCESLIPDSATMVMYTRVAFPCQAAVGLRKIEPSRPGKRITGSLKHGRYDIRCKDCQFAWSYWS